MISEIKKRLTTELKQEIFPENLILSGFRGSVSHGTYLPSTDPDSVDDIDLMSTFLFPIDAYLGIKQPKETVEKFVREWDTVSYEFRWFVRLLLKNNPNVLSLLFLRPEYYIDTHPYGQILIDNRDLFASKIVYSSFTKYAYSQIKKTTAMVGKYPTDIAYLAGIFDGEGHVCIQRSNSRKGMTSAFHNLDIGITNTDEDLISSLHDIYGGHVGSTGIRGQHRTNCYRWRLNGPNTISFLKLLLPHLKIKRRQAEIAIAFQQDVLRRRRGSKLTPEEVKKRDEYMLALKASRKDKSINIPEGLYDQPTLYKAAYMGKKRKDLAEKFGYDPKAAAHSIRLLRMGIEFLIEGKLNVFREDSSLLLEIKRGQWELEEIHEEAKRLLKLADEAYVKSSLPPEPDYDKVNTMVKGILEDYICGGECDGA